MIIPTGYAQATFIFSGPCVPNGAVITLGCNPVSSDPVDVAEDFNAAWVSNLDAVTSANLTLASILVKMGPNDTGNFYELPVGTAGNVSGDCDPPNTAWLIHKVTAMGGRKGRGRIYLPGVFSANTANNGAIDGSTLSTLQAAWSGFLGDLDTAGVPLALLHTGSDEPNGITSLSVDPFVATQRRRLRA